MLAYDRLSSINSIFAPRSGVIAEIPCIKLH